MPIQDSDLLLIEDTSGVSKKIAASKLKANLAANTYNNYKLLVNKPDYSSRFVYAQNMQASVATTDYMLVERAGVSYKVNGQQIIDYFPSVPAGAAGAIVDVENTTIDAAWTSTQPAAGIRWQGVAFGLGIFVAVARTTGQIYTSSDNGATWTKRYELPNAEWKGVTFGNGRFVAVGDNGSVRAIYSDDGINWSQAAAQLEQPWESVAYGNGLFVCIANSGGRAMYSSDGTNWIISFVDNYQWTRITFGDGKFVCVNQSHGHFTISTTNGSTWTTTRYDPAEIYGWTSLSYGNGQFIAGSAGNNGFIMRSSDGINWSLSDTGLYFNARSGTFGGNKFVFAYGDRAIYSTNDAATTWTDTNLEGGEYQDIAYGNGYFVAVDQGSSTNLISRSFGGTGGVELESELTLVSETNLDLFTVGDAITMVDSDGDVASYTPVTSTITNVGNVPVPTAQVTVKTEVGGIDSPGNPTTPAEGTAIANIWNGQYSSYPNDFLTAANGGFITITDIGMTEVTSVEFYSYSGNQDRASVNDGDFYKDPSDPSLPSWVTAYNGPAITLNSLYLQKADGTSYVKVGAIKVNGRILSTTSIAATKNLTFSSPNPDLKFFNPGDNVNSITKEFIARVYTGNGTEQSIKTGFSPDLLWIKKRNQTVSHNLFDTVRGSEYRLNSNEKGGQFNDPDYLKSFDPEGFTVGYQNGTNGSGGDFVAWAWDAGDTAPITNTSGSITSLVKSNGNFSIATYTAPDGMAGNQTVGHGLSGTPDFIIIKNCVDNYSWDVYHSSLPTNDPPYSLMLNETFMQRTGAFGSYPTASVINIKNAYTYVQNQLYVAYSWKEKAGESSFGSYTGGGTPTLNCGFEPSLVIIKRSSSAQSWAMYDNARTPTNPRKKTLACDTPDAEISENDRTIDFTSTGFTVVGTNDVCNKPGETYIYAAFAGGVVGPEVLSTDTAANTMVVDSGTWSNGEIVTAPTKSGTGNFAGNTGAVVDVSNSNQQWIDNTNRLGESFFIKSASTRTGLAILRSQAIKVAQAYDPAKAPYPVRSLVIYEGDYYVNAGVVGPGQNKWIDLGRAAGNA